MLMSLLGVSTADFSMDKGDEGVPWCNKEVGTSQGRASKPT